MKVVSQIGHKATLFQEKKLLQYKHLRNFLREVVLYSPSQIVKNSQIIHLNKFS